MSILNTSVSGMQANSNWLSTISQNVANANTTGYKNVETDFSSLVDQIANGDADVRRRLHEPGLAQRAAGQCRLHFDRDRPCRPGLRVSSSCPTPAAHIYLTRNGSFTPDASGNLVNSAGYYLMAANVQNGVSPLAANSLTDLQKVNVVNAGQTATATTTGSLTANLPSTATPVAPANLPSANSASSTYTEATSLVVYDNLGGSHTINLYYTNTGSNTWEVDAFDASKASAGGGFPYSSGPLATQTLTFNPTTGALSSGSPLSLHGAERADDEPRSQQHDAACGGLQRDRRNRERKCARAASAASPSRPVDP